MLFGCLGRHAPALIRDLFCAYDAHKWIHQKEGYNAPLCNAITRVDHLLKLTNMRIRKHLFARDKGIEREGGRKSLGMPCLNPTVNMERNLPTCGSRGCPGLPVGASLCWQSA
eukprot:scaffold558_cov139-Pinguiococcus_pyrenoidosus.AAC.1